MKKIILIVLIFGSLASFCFANETNQSQPARMEILTGEIFTITLRASPTTGYQWQFVIPPDEKIISLINSEYIPYKTKRVGAEGKQIWTFKALKVGEVIMSLKYVRPWEKNTPPQNEQSYLIIIK